MLMEHDTPTLSPFRWKIILFLVYLGWAEQRLVEFCLEIIIRQVDGLITRGQDNLCQLLFKIRVESN